jgi:hypothetical protein
LQPLLAAALPCQSADFAQLADALSDEPQWNTPQWNTTIDELRPGPPLYGGGLDRDAKLSVGSDLKPPCNHFTGDP